MNKIKSSLARRKLYNSWQESFNRKYSHKQPTEEQIFWEISKICKKLDNE